MRILILGLNYLPESTSIGPYTADLAEFLHARGHTVQVVTGFPLAPQWRIWDGYRGRFFMREVINGVSVLRTWLFVPKNPKGAVGRILFDCSFAVSSLLGSIFSEPFDVIVAISPPLQLGLTGLIVGAVHRAPVFLEIKDLVPDAAIAVGAMREGSTPVKIAHALERLVYRGSRGIGVICDGMVRNLIGKGVPKDKVELLPDYIDLKFIHPTPPANEFRTRFDIAPDQFLAIYSGSVAAKQGLQTFVQAAALLESEAAITCCLIGEGPYLPELKQLASDLTLRRFRFLPLQPREALSLQLSAADVLVITQRKSVTDIVFPGKLLYYMASGRPILAAVSEESETGRFIRDNNVGMVVPPEDPERLAEAIRWLQAHPEETRQLGRNGRKVAETRFDRDVVLKRFAAYIEGGLKSGSLNE